MVVDMMIRKLALAGDWSSAVQMAIDVGGLTIRDIALGLEVMQSSVGRWVRNETSPPRALIPYFTEKLVGLLRA